MTGGLLGAFRGSDSLVANPGRGWGVASGFLDDGELVVAESEVDGVGAGVAGDGSSAWSFVGHEIDYSVKRKMLDIHYLLLYDKDMTPIHISYPSPTKTLESYADYYVFEQRGWRVKIVNTGSVASDQLARTLADESDIQLLLHLAVELGGAKDAELPEIDIRVIRRDAPFRYSTISGKDL